MHTSLGEPWVLLLPLWQPLRTLYNHAIGPDLLVKTINRVACFIHTVFLPRVVCSDFTEQQLV